MKHEFIKKLDKCAVGDCPHCSRCSEMNAGKKEDEEIKNTDGLYNKEVEQYYFYFLENKAS
jgi:hypothetical protein